MSDPRIGGLPCDYQNLNDVNQLLWGGTSVSSPAMAGITALVSQAVGGKLGNTAPVLYQLGKLQFTNSLLLNGCNSTLGTKEAGACIFNNVTIGDNAEPCVKGQTNCFFNKYATNGIGVLSTNPGTHEIDAFPATPGYSLATGLGTVNATNLVLNYYLYIYNP
jgi:subtilase family serine protease